MATTTQQTKTIDFVVRRDDLSQCKFVDAGERKALNPGEVSLRVTKFAFTANNVTYGVAGDMLSYWNFFPAAEGWGRIPVWGIGVVAESKCEGIAEGERFYGYFPMSSFLVVQPEKVAAHGFVDASAHRQSLPPTYNLYSRMTPELGFAPAQDDFVMLFRPLFMTSFLLDDYLADNDFFGAEKVVLSSASSKTAFGLAFLLSQRAAPRPKIVGLTSPHNVSFVEGLGCYDEVVSYCDMMMLPNEGTAAFVDMAGNAEVISLVHHRFGDRLKHSCLVGITHWKARGSNEGLPGPEPAFFFAPDQGQKRNKEWGAAGFQERFGAAWGAFMKHVSGWIQVVHGEGHAEIERVYLETLDGKAKPNEGHILSL